MVPRIPITTSINSTFISTNFQLFDKSRYPSKSSLSSIFILWYTGIVKSDRLQILFFWLIKTRFTLLAIHLYPNSIKIIRIDLTLLLFFIFLISRFSWEVCEKIMDNNLHFGATLELLENLVDPTKHIVKIDELSLVSIWIFISLNILYSR